MARGGAALQRRPIAQLAAVARAPAPDVPVGHAGTRVAAAHPQASDVARKLDGEGLGRARDVGPPELSVRIAAPAGDLRSDEPTRVVDADADRRLALERPDDGRREVGIG